MVIFLNLDGSCENVTPQKVYQGSNNVTEITLVAPFPSTTKMQIGFVLPDGLYWESSEHARYAPMEFVPQETVSGINVWKFILPFSVTAQHGDLYIAVNATTTDGNTTSYMVKQIIEESVLPNKPNPPDPSVYEYLQLYLARLDGRTENVANLVKSVQKVAPNAITYTTNSGVESAPIVIEGGDTAPIPVNAASTVEIPLDAWQPVYSGQAVTGYSALITAAMHGQMRDGATANDLWVSFDETDGGVISGVYQGYTVSETGDITINVNQPVAMTVRVWNGKGLVDNMAREMIEKETERAEAEEAHLQEQIDELQNTGVDLTARRMVQEETERATAAENELTADVQDLRDQLGQKVSKSGDTMTGSLTVPKILGAGENEGKGIIPVRYITRQELGTATSDVDGYIQAWIKKVCELYPNTENCIFIGSGNPAAAITLQAYIYNTSERNSDGVPRYAYGVCLEYGHTNNIQQFSIVEHTYNPKKPFMTREGRWLDGDVKSATHSGVYYCSADSTGLPSGANRFGQLFVSHEHDTIAQIYISHENKQMWARGGKYNGGEVWTDWYRLANYDEVYSPNNPPPPSVPPVAEPTTYGTVYGSTKHYGGTTLGYGATASLYNPTMSLPQNIAIGDSANAESYYGGAIVIGDSAEAAGYGSSIVIGVGAKTHAYYGDIIIGNGAKNTFTGGPSGHNIIIAHDRTTDESGVVILGDNSVQKLYCHVTTITQLSDTRLKEEIEPADIDRCLDDVNRLPVTRYKYKDFVGKSRDKHVTGFLADDVEKVFPKSVSSSKKTFYEYDENGEYIEEPDVNENGEPILYENGEPQMRRKSFVMNDVKDITMTEAIPTLWGAVQSLSKTVKEQQKQIAELKERLSALEVNHGAKN